MARNIDPRPERVAAHLVGLSAESRAAVRAFHQAALANSGSDDGPPGIREKYSPDYYAAFVRDPDGNRIEAVTRRPEE